MSIGVLALILGALCGVVVLITAPQQEEKPRNLCGSYGKAFEGLAPKEIF